MANMLGRLSVMATAGIAPDRAKELKRVCRRNLEGGSGMKHKRFAPNMHVRGLNAVWFRARLT